MHSFADHVITPADGCPPEISSQIVAVPVRFLVLPHDARKRIAMHQEDEGIIEIHRDLVTDIEALFPFMMSVQYGITSALPASYFGYSDEASMLANNTSGFNYRQYRSTDGLIKWSNHSYGRAIDINPWLNPYIFGSIIQPKGAIYDPTDPTRLGTLTADSPVVRFLKDLGWVWGGDWKDLKDWQHFEKLISTNPA